MAVFIKKIFIKLLSACTTGSFSGSLASNSKASIKCVSLNNRPCQARPTIANIKSNETLFYPFTVSDNVFGGSCNTIEYEFQIK